MRNQPIILLSILIFFLVSIYVLLYVLLSGFTNYGMEDAASDQKLFSRAFANSDVTEMQAAADNFRRYFKADNVAKLDDPDCIKRARYGMQYDVPKMQKSALDWVQNKSAAKALKTWEQIEKHQDILLGRLDSCSLDEVEELKHYRELIALIRADVRKQHDIDGLIAKKEAKRQELWSKRLANCNLEEGLRRVIFQQFVQLEDIYGLKGRPRVVQEVARTHNISGDCVEQTVKSATIYHPEWIPEPL